MSLVDLVATQLLHGLVYGMLLFLIAAGLALIFGMLRILNMAHAAVYMLGAYLCATVVEATGSFWLALLAIPPALGLAGAVIERTMLRRVAKFGHAYELLLTFGLFYMAIEATLFLWGTAPLQAPAPAALQGSIALLGGKYPVYRLFIFGFAALIAAVLLAVLRLTRTGIVIRAAVSDPAMLEALGIDVERVRAWVFGVGTALAAAAGVIAAPFIQADPSMAGLALLDAFAVVVIGGFGSVFGALVAALLIGELQSVSILVAPDWAGVVEFLLMAAVLVFRPRGLFGEAQ